MSLDDRLRDAAEALITANTHSHDIEQGARLLGEAYQNLGLGAATARHTQDFDADEAVHALGAMCAERGDWRGAALCFHQAAMHDFADAALRLGEVLEQLGRPDEAMQWYRHAEENGFSEASAKLTGHSDDQELPPAVEDAPKSSMNRSVHDQAPTTVIPLERASGRPEVVRRETGSPSILPLVARRERRSQAQPTTLSSAPVPETSSYYSTTSLAMDEGTGQHGRSLLYPASTLLGRLSERTREEFLAIGVSESRQANTTVIKQGELDSNALLLLHGSVKVHATNPGGERTLLAIRVGGDLLGEMAALADGPRSATVISCTDIFYKRMTRTEFRNFLARHPDAAIELATILGERLHLANRRRVEHGRPASVRFARILVDLCEAYGTRTGGRWDLGVPLTREELASMAGIKLSTAEKIIRSLQQDGLVSGRYRGIVVLDMARMRTQAEMM